MQGPYTKPLHHLTLPKTKHSRDHLIYMGSTFPIIYHKVTRILKQYNFNISKFAFENERTDTI